MCSGTIACSAVSVLLNTTDWVTPLASITGSPAGALNQTLTFTLGADGTGLPADTKFTYVIDWNGDGSDVQTVTDVDGTTVTHSFTTADSHNIGMTATDPTPNTSALATHAITILPVSVSIETDPADATKQALVLDGSSNAGTTAARSWAKSEAMAKSIPAVEPVTSAFLCVSCKSIGASIYAV